MSLSTAQKHIIQSIDEDASSSQWKDWKWQVRHRVRDLETFEDLLRIKMSEEQRADFQKTVSRFPMSVTPYYLSLINTDDYENDPIFRQSFPSPKEIDLKGSDMEDPLHEDHDSPVECLVHRYPDRVLMLVSGVCSMYCRHCTRKRRVGDRDQIPTREEILKAIDYIKNTPQVRDVLLSGGDPFLLSDEYLDWILSELAPIEHVEVVRIGTRTPVVLPYRITDSLIKVLKKYQPLWINTHFNHPRELTRSARAALAKLADAGIPLGNQSVLLAGGKRLPKNYEGTRPQAGGEPRTSLLPIPVRSVGRAFPFPNAGW